MIFLNWSLSPCKYLITNNQQPKLHQLHHHHHHKQLPKAPKLIPYPSIPTQLLQNHHSPKTNPPQTPPKTNQAFQPTKPPTAMIFSLMPPTGSTLPVKDISPVMARFCLTGVLKARDRRAVTSVQPALGPSFGVAPWGV